MTETQMQDISGKLLSDANPPDGRTNRSNETDDVICGVGPCTPSFLQRCATLPVFVGCAGVTGLATSCITIYITSQLTTLEKTFGFSSTISGIIMACNDIGYLSTTLFASYYARRSHIPRILAFATILFGISGIASCIPYLATRDKFIIRDEDVGVNESGVVRDSSSMLCLDNSTHISPDCSQNITSQAWTSFFGLSHSDTMTAICIISVSMILQGVGKSPRLPFISTYIDDNAVKAKTPLYIGIVMGISIFGPAIAFVVGAFFSTIYVTLQDTQMTDSDPQWIGAWWLGFLVFGMFAILAALPLCLFPRHLIPKPQRLHTKERKESKGRLLSDAIGLLRTLWRLISNPVFTLIVIALSLNHCALSGNITFFPKYLETQFSQQTWKANMLTGLTGILAASMGPIIGGKIAAKLKLTVEGSFKMIILLFAMSVACQASGLWLGCDQTKVTSVWAGQSNKDYLLSTNSSCSSGCTCDEEILFPVCDNLTKTTFYSPCHAGCSSTGELFHEFSNCTCSSSGAVTPGFCEEDCNSLIPFLVFSFLCALTGTLTIPVLITVTMRSVPNDDKAMSLGLSNFFTNLTGWMLGPIIYGGLIDQTCLLWQEKCGQIGTCALYDLVSFKHLFNGMTVLLRGGTLILLAVNYWFFVRTGRYMKYTDTSVTDKNEVGENGEFVKQDST